MTLLITTHEPPSRGTVFIAFSSRACRGSTGFPAWALKPFLGFTGFPKGSVKQCRLSKALRLIQVFQHRHLRWNS